MIGIKRKQLRHLFASMTIVLAIIAVALALHLHQLQDKNQQIRALLGDQVVPAEDLDLDAVEVLLAYGYQQRQHNLHDQTIELYSSAERLADKQQRVWIYYNLGNLYLSQAVSLAENLDVARATAMADVAKDFFRTTLRIAPDFYEAKYNYEAAQRLSRDLPLGDVHISEESDDGISEFWSSMPGFPIGLP